MTMGSPLPPVLSQFDGVLVLGQGLRVGDKMVDRFVLGSLNVQAASEAALDKRRRPKPTDNYAGVESGPPMLAQRPTDWARKSFSTAGLSLLDRGRLEQAAVQFAARNVHAEKSDVFLDAEDLTIGYRVDVVGTDTGITDLSGIVSFCPTLMRSVARLLTALSAGTVVPCAWAILLNESPCFTT